MDKITPDFGIDPSMEGKLAKCIMEELEKIKTLLTQKGMCLDTHSWLIDYALLFRYIPKEILPSFLLVKKIIEADIDPINLITIGICVGETLEEFSNMALASIKAKRLSSRRKRNEADSEIFREIYDKYENPTPGKPKDSLRNLLRKYFGKKIYDNKEYNRYKSRYYREKVRIEYQSIPDEDTLHNKFMEFLLKKTSYVLGKDKNGEICRHVVRVSHGPSRSLFYRCVNEERKIEERYRKAQDEMFSKLAKSKKRK